MVAFRISSRGTGLLLAAAVALLAAPAAAQYQSTGVIFSFTPQRIAGAQQYALVPIPTDRVRDDVPLQASIPAAFGLLRSGKSATYGNSTLRMTDADLQANQVAVMIDPQKVEHLPIISAETVYTFTQLGVERVVFPGIDEDGMTRQDVPFAAYRMQVPMWQALPPARIHAADVMLPDGGRVEADAFYARLEEDDQELEQLALTYLSGDDQQARYAVLNKLAELRIDGYEEHVVPLLESDDPQLRSLALNALAPSEELSVWNAVLDVLRSDPEPSIRQQAAGLIARSPRAEFRIFEIVYRARNGETEGRLQAIAEMGQARDPRLEEELIGLLADPEPQVGLAAVEALEARRAWGALSAAMNDEELPHPVRLASATALAESATEQSRLAGLRYRAFELVGEPAIATVDAIAGLTDVDPRPVLEELLAHPDPAVAIRSTEQLAQRGDVEALPSLSEAVAAAREAQASELAAAIETAALTILGSQPLRDIQRFATGSDTFLKRAAYRALGDAAQGGETSEDIYQILVDGLSDRQPEIRGGSALALASFRTEDALQSILAIADDVDATVRADVAHALAKFDPEQHTETINPILIDYMQSGEPQVEAAAIDALGDLGQSQVISVIRSKTEHPEAEVRAASIRALVKLVDPAEPRSVIDSIAGRLRDPDMSVRVLAAQLLGEFDNELAVLAVSQVVNQQNPELRFAAIDALGRTGHRSAVGVLVNLLEDPDREIRLATIRALRDLGFRDAVASIEEIRGLIDDPTTAEAVDELIAYLQEQGE